MCFQGSQSRPATRGSAPHSLPGNGTGAWFRYRRTTILESHERKPTANGPPLDSVKTKDDPSGKKKVLRFRPVCAEEYVSCSAIAIRVSCDSRGHLTSRGNYVTDGSGAQGTGVAPKLAQLGLPGGITAEHRICLAGGALNCTEPALGAKIEGVGAETEPVTGDIGDH